MEKNIKRKKKKSIDLFYPIIIVLCLIIFSFLYSENSGNYITTNEAVVEGRLISLYSRVSGPITHLNVEENQEVSKGDVLLEIDVSDYMNRMKIIQYNLKQVRTKLYELELIDKDRAAQNPETSNTNKSLHRYGFSRSDFGKYAPGLIPEKEPDKSILTRDSDLKIAQEKEKKEKERLAKEKKNLPEIKYIDLPTEDKEKEVDEDLDPKKLMQDIEKFEAQIDQIKLDMSYAKLYAPQDGTISVINVAESGYVDAGESLLSITPKKVWVTAYYPQSQIDKISIGQSVIVRISAYPGRKFKGVVDDILTRGEKNSTIQYSKTGEPKIPIRIMFTEDYSAYNITPGTSVSVSIRIK